MSIWEHKRNVENTNHRRLFSNNKLYESAKRVFWGGKGVLTSSMVAMVIITCSLIIGGNPSKPKGCKLNENCKTVKKKNENTFRWKYQCYSNNICQSPMNCCYCNLLFFNFFVGLGIPSLFREHGYQTPRCRHCLLLLPLASLFEERKLECPHHRQMVQLWHNHAGHHTGLKHVEKPDLL